MQPTMATGTLAYWPFVLNVFASVATSRTGAISPHSYPLPNCVRYTGSSSEGKANSNLGLFAAKKPKTAPATRRLFVADLITVKHRPVCNQDYTVSCGIISYMRASYGIFQVATSFIKTVSRGFGIVLRDDDDAGSPSESNWPESLVHKASPQFLPYAEIVASSLLCSVHPTFFFPRLHDSNVLSLPGAKLPAMPP